jgi:periplasmic protein TonB
VTYLESSFLRFFAVSLALHMLFLLLWPKPPINVPASAPIPVALLPAPDRPPERVPEAPRPPPVKKTPRSIPKEAPSRISQAPAIIAKKSSPILENTPLIPQEKTQPKEQKQAEPPPQLQLQEQPVIAERALPTLKELLPPLTWSSAGQRDKQGNQPIPLNTTEPRYVTYFGSIQRSIDANWQYPELALQYGLQGRVVIEFAILENGRIEGVKLVRSSGSLLLDDEALRAIKAAAPFPPIPPWIEPKPLLISAGMEYHDGRIHTRFAP